MRLSHQAVHILKAAEWRSGKFDSSANDNSTLGTIVRRLSPSHNSHEGTVEIIFLIAGLPLVVLGLAVIVSEAKARRDTELLKARVIGFSIGRSANAEMASYHPVAE